MVPTVTAMCSQVRKVRSLAKNVLGSMRMGVVLQGERSGLGWRPQPLMADLRTAPEQGASMATAQQQAEGRFVCLKGLRS